MKASSRVYGPAGRNYFSDLDGLLFIPYGNKLENGLRHEIGEADLGRKIYRQGEKGRTGNKGKGNPGGKNPKGRTMKIRPLEEIKALKREVRKLRNENVHFKKIYEIGNALRPEKNIDKLLPLILVEISKFLRADRSTLFLIDYENRCLLTKFAEGMGEKKIIIELKMGLAGTCVLTRQMVNVAYAYDIPHFYAEIDKKTGYRTESVLCVPWLDQNGEVIGAVELLNKKTGVFHKADEDAGQETSAMLSLLNMNADEDRKKAQAMVHALRDKTRADRSSIFLLDREKSELSSIMADKIDGGDIILNLNLGIAGLVAVTGSEINIPDAYADPRFDKSIDQITGYKTNSLLAIPLRNHVGEIIGVIEAL
jgi:adenylate cyclase